MLNDLAAGVFLFDSAIGLVAFVKGSAEGTRECHCIDRLSVACDRSLWQRRRADKGEALPNCFMNMTLPLRTSLVMLPFTNLACLVTHH